MRRTPPGASSGAGHSDTMTGARPFPKSARRWENRCGAAVAARFVTAAETQQGKRWDEAKIKALTGGDPISEGWRVIWIGGVREGPPGGAIALRHKLHRGDGGDENGRHQLLRRAFPGSLRHPALT